MAPGSAQNGASDAGKSAQHNETSRPGVTATDTKSGTKASEAKSSDTKSSADKSSSSDMKSSSDTKSSPSGAAANDAAKPSPSGSAATSSPSNEKTASVAPPPEKRTQITSVFKQEKVEPVKNVNFNITVGAVVPASVHFYPVPRRIVEIYPEWRGYEFIFVDGRYIIVRPATHEIVFILDV